MVIQAALSSKVTSVDNKPRVRYTALTNCQRKGAGWCVSPSPEAHDCFTTLQTMDEPGRNYTTPPSTSQHSRTILYSYTKLIKTDGSQKMTIRHISRQHATTCHHVQISTRREDIKIPRTRVSRHRADRRCHDRDTDLKARSHWCTAGTGRTSGCPRAR